MAKKKGYGDVAETLAPKVSSALSKYLITFFSIKWLKRSMDAIDAYTLPISLLISWLLPEEGFLKVTSVITSETLAGLKREGENRLKDWDNAKNRVYQNRLKIDSKTAEEVEDDDVENLSLKEKKIFEKNLRYPSRDKSLKDLKNLGKVGEKIAEKLGLIKWEDLQKLMQKIPKSVGDAKKYLQSLETDPTFVSVEETSQNWLEKQKRIRQERLTRKKR